MLKYRILTALCLIPILLVLLFYTSRTVFLSISALIFLLAAYEGFNLVGLTSIVKKVFGLIILLVLLTTSTYFVNSVLWLGVAWWFLAFFLLLTYPRNLIIWDRYISARLLIGIAMLVPSWLSLVFLRGLTGGQFWILYVLLIIWGADTGAYFAGRAFGKHKLAPLISPGKSWEGVLGGLLVVVLVYMLGYYVYFSKFNSSKMIWGLFLLTLFTTVMSIVGDLTESMFKRRQNVKDSGTLLPGHGGLLDRIDSLLAAGPTFSVGLMLLL